MACRTGEHLGRYEHVVAGLTASGFRVHAMDHQGHGRSDGTRCYFERLDDLVSDVVQYTQAVTSEQPQLPTFVLAHSLGSLVTLLAAQNKEFASRLAGVVLSAPALAFDPKLDTPFNRFLVLTLSGWLPKVCFHARVCTRTCMRHAYTRAMWHGVGVRRGVARLACRCLWSTLTPARCALSRVWWSTTSATRWCTTAACAFVWGMRCWQARGVRWRVRLPSRCRCWWSMARRTCCALRAAPLICSRASPLALTRRSRCGPASVMRC
ncbi:alpha/beta fold hydrolase [archaeon]|nr:MAG: alpha/beta fold hydrolase [archaeon]